jgi:hypothetical protein
MSIKMYSNVIILTIFVSALIAIVEIPNIFENVIAQQQLEDNQQVSSSSSSSDRDRILVEEEEEEEEEEARSSADRIPNDGALRR